MKVKPNQVVVALTPVMFAPLAGAISVWAAKNAGVDIDQSSLQAVFIAGATIALAKAGLWLKGWQEYEKREAGAAGGSGAAAAPAPAPEVDLDDDFDDSDLDGFLEDDDLARDDLADESFADADLVDDDEPVPAGVAG